MHANKNACSGPILNVSSTRWFQLHNRTARIGNGHVALRLAGCVKPRVWQNLTGGLVTISPLWEMGMCPSS